MRFNLVLFGILLAALVVLSVKFAGVTSPVPFAYDEADYMYAGTRGFAANYLDQPSQSLPEFIRKGRELAGDKSRRTGMSEYIRGIGDITFYRHYHGPTYALWIAACRSLGVTGERAYRASGLLIHSLAAVLIFWLFRRAFPEAGPLSAWVAAIVFATNRTALVTAMSITQHGMFSLTATATLFLMAVFIRTRRIGYWYATAACLAGAVASVEISVVVLGVVVLSMFAVQGRDWKRACALIAKGTAVFFLTLLVIWPKSLLQLGVFKGYLYLAYIAVYRKTFSPIGPIDLWGFKLKTYPFEFLPLVAGLIGLLIWFRRSKYRLESLPFLLYAIAFLGVTMVITVPYTYYHCSLVMALAVITGLAFGEAQRRAGKIGAGVLLAALLISITVSDAGYYNESKKEAAADSLAAHALKYVGTEAAPTRPVFVPYQLLPTLHYYYPDIKVTAYDKDWTVSRLAAQTIDSPQGADVLCPSSICDSLRQVWPAAAVVAKQRIGEMKEVSETVWAYQVLHY
jgi:hypothetical protein